MSFFWKDARYDYAQPAPFRPAGQAGGPTPDGAPEAHRLFAESHYFRDDPVDGHAPVVGCPVVGGLGVDRVSPAVFRRVAQERLDEV